MHFPLIHTGRRFFFFTFVVEGRRRLLSRLEWGAKRPVLTALGERVKAVWAALHKINAHFTASDFVIMPDHVHLLLIVNSVEEFRFNPLVFAWWWMVATTDGGLCPPIPPADWWHFYPAQQGCGGGEGKDPAPQGCGGAAPVACSFAWSRDYWIDISFDARQLAAIRRYIRMNPARYFWKLDNPDMFLRRGNFRHPRLDSALTWAACGDLTILASPFLFLVRLTMKKTAAELEEEIAEHIEHVKRAENSIEDHPYQRDENRGIVIGDLYFRSSRLYVVTLKLFLATGLSYFEGKNLKIISTANMIQMSRETAVCLPMPGSGNS